MLVHVHIIGHTKACVCFIASVIILLCAFDVFHDAVSLNLFMVPHFGGMSILFLAGTGTRGVRKKYAGKTF